MADLQPRSAGPAPAPAAERSPAELTADPAALFRALARHLGGPLRLAAALGCSRATAYNLLSGRKRWSAQYLERTRKLLGGYPLVSVTARARGPFEIPPEDWRALRSQALILAYDGALQVKGDAMWPLVAGGQHVLYRSIRPEELQPGDLVIARLKNGETVIKVWQPSPLRAGEVFLLPPFRTSRDFRSDPPRPHLIAALQDLRKVVGVWLG